MQVRDDCSLNCWPGTMGGLFKRTTVDAGDSNVKLVVLDKSTSYIERVSKRPAIEWCDNVLQTMLQGDLEASGRLNDISLLPSDEVNKIPILKSFEATTRSDPITNKRVIQNPEFELTEDEGIVLTSSCEGCKSTRKLELSPDEFLEQSIQKEGKALIIQECSNCGTSKELLIVSGSRTVFNWFKVMVTIKNDLERIRVWLTSKQLFEKVPSAASRFEIPLESAGKEVIEQLIAQLHLQYKYSMLGIIIAVSDAGKSLDIDIEPLPNPVEHWHKKRHVMTDLWWNEIKTMLESEKECEGDCIICSRYSGEDWHDVAPHIGQCDVYGRFHHGTDIYSLSWVERMMVTASYWDELGNKDPVEVEKAKKSIGRACIDVALGLDDDFDQRVAKQRCLLNLNTYTLRRCLNESRYLAPTGLGSMRVGKLENLSQMLRGRLFEGMTLPYVEDDMLRRSCSKCADIIVLAGQLGIIFHDAIDLPNDIFNGEYMNVYRMAASGGMDSLMKFVRGCHTLLKVMASTGANNICCKNVLQSALGNTVSWYFYCARYNYCSNVQKVFAQPYNWESLHDIDAAIWVGRLIGCTENTLETIKSWSNLPLISHEEFGCKNKTPKKRFHHMRNAILNGIIVDADTAELESAKVFCELAAAGRKHQRGKEGECLCCDVIYECLELTIKGDKVGRFVNHALRLGTGKIAMVIDC